MGSRVKTKLDMGIKKRKKTGRKKKILPVAKRGDLLPFFYRC